MRSGLLRLARLRVAAEPIRKRTKWSMRHGTATNIACTRPLQKRDGVAMEPLAVSRSIIAGYSNGWLGCQQHALQKFAFKAVYGAKTAEAVARRLVAFEAGARGKKIRRRVRKIIYTTDAIESAYAAMQVLKNRPTSQAMKRRPSLCIFSCETSPNSEKQKPTQHTTFSSTKTHFPTRFAQSHAARSIFTYSAQLGTRQYSGCYRPTLKISKWARPLQLHLALCMISAEYRRIRTRVRGFSHNLTGGRRCCRC